MATLKIQSGIEINFGSDWSEFKKWINGTNASLRYTWTDDSASYTILSVDGPVHRVVGINKDGGTDQVDFETNFKATASITFANVSASGSPLAFLETPQSNGAARVAIAPLEGSETIYSTHNFVDPTTWYSQSTRVTNEVLTDSGNGLTWDSINPIWIDMVSGKVQDEDGIIEEEAERTPSHHGWSVVIKVDDVVKTMREPLESSGGDYTVNYSTGKIIFFSSQAGSVVKATYSKESGSGWRLKPMPNKILDIIDAEAQFSADVDMTDTLEFAVKGPIDIFAPQMLQSNGGPYPPGTMIPLVTQKYKKFTQLIDEARGAYPVISSIGGTRGVSAAIYGFPFQYSTTRELKSSLGLELWISLVHERKFGGQHATATFYCTSRSE